MPHVESVPKKGHSTLFKILLEMDCLVVTQMVKYILKVVTAGQNVQMVEHVKEGPAPVYPHIMVLSAKMVSFI